MATAHAHRAGMAILSIELEEANGNRVRVKVRTVGDLRTKEQPPSEERDFGDIGAAIDYLRGWLDDWVAAS